MADRRRFVPANLRLKATAVFLALLVYLSVFLDNEHEATISMPLVLDGPPRHLMVVGDVPETVSARVIGPGRQLLRWWVTREVGGLHTVLPLRGDDRKLTAAITSADVVVPLGMDVRVLEIVEPRTVSLQLDEVTERTVPVTPVRAGQPPLGYIVSGPMTVDPESVVVRGPSELIAGLESVTTTPIDLGGQSRPIHERIPLAGAEEIAFDPDHVWVSADIERKDQLSIDRIPIRVTNSRQYRVVVEPDSGSIVVMGPRSQLDRIRQTLDAGQPPGLVITVDVAGKGPGEYEVGPNVAMTDDLRLIGVSPPAIRVTLADEPLESP